MFLPLPVMRSRFDLVAPLIFTLNGWIEYEAPHQQSDPRGGSVLLSATPGSGGMSAVFAGWQHVVCPATNEKKAQSREAV
jgi:hypothetical protein